MKLLRWGEAGEELPGLLDSKGRIRDLSHLIEDFGPHSLTEQGMDSLRAIDPEALPLVEGSPRIGACLPFVTNFYCIGLNYAKHAAESGMPPPAEPVLFSKASSALSGPYDPIVIPKGSEKTDWEVELGVVIGREASYVSEAEALSCVAGYCVVNDVSERAFQLESTGQWIKGKSAPTFGPTGPHLVSADAVPDPQALQVWLDVNGERMQEGDTSDMIFSVAEIISYMSRHMLLQPGDLIATGTPHGVGMGLKPPRFLKAGDEVRLGVEGLGEQHQTAVAWGS
ncbi:fumarylacetoacetate hydrolase family protein [Limibacillus sp. MBR-115]|uniref:fumarylacetoacetate hydrolase family protein n=1 Tax=Limibacillus sp. MBR-115 TaxID=3156465 RepID=UPI0033914C55